MALSVWLRTHVPADVCGYSFVRFPCGRLSFKLNCVYSVHRYCYVCRQVRHVSVCIAAEHTETVLNSAQNNCQLFARYLRSWSFPSHIASPATRLFTIRWRRVTEREDFEFHSNESRRVCAWLGAAELGDRCRSQVSA